METAPTSLAQVRAGGSAGGVISQPRSVRPTECLGVSVWQEDCPSPSPGRSAATSWHTRGTAGCHGGTCFSPASRWRGKASPSGKLWRTPSPRAGTSSKETTTCGEDEEPEAPVSGASSESKSVMRKHTNTTSITLPPCPRFKGAVRDIQLVGHQEKQMSLCTELVASLPPQHVSVNQTSKFECFKKTNGPVLQCQNVLVF